MSPLVTTQAVGNWVDDAVAPVDRELRVGPRGGLSGPTVFMRSPVPRPEDPPFPVPRGATWEAYIKTLPNRREKRRVKKRFGMLSGSRARGGGLTPLLARKRSEEW